MAHEVRKAVLTSDRSDWITWSMSTAGLAGSGIRPYKGPAGIGWDGRKGIHAADQGDPPLPAGINTACADDGEREGP